MDKLDKDKFLTTGRNIYHRTIRFGRKLGPGNLFFFASVATAFVCA